MKKIVFISHLADRTGAPIVLLHLLRWLKQRGDFEFVILLEATGELENDFRDIAKTYILNTPSAVNVWKNRWQRLTKKTEKHEQKVIKAIAKFKPDIIYSNTN